MSREVDHKVKCSVQQDVGGGTGYEIITRGGDLYCAWHTGSSSLVPAVAVVREEVSSAEREGPQKPGWGLS